MSRKYKFTDNDKLYFVSFAVINWIDLFIRNEYKEVVVKSLEYCQREKGLELYGWCIMTSHVHLLIGSVKDPMQNIMRDLKRHTSEELHKAIQKNNIESRKEWMLWMMERAGKKNSNNINFQLWQQHNHPIEIINNEMAHQKLQYIHYNPVTAGFVAKPEDWLFSSAIDYYNGKGLLQIIKLDLLVV
ncbi:MAG: transposase [Chitinophagaceae bacterium]|nr:transposase [Chitinophagaceae bacterium]